MGARVYDSETSEHYGKPTCPSFEKFQGKHMLAKLPFEVSMFMKLNNIYFFSIFY
jgi:hypothetical protein